MTNQRRIALLGTGLMGFPMSQNILKAGHQLTVWNRSAAKAAPLTQEGARVATCASQAVEGAEFVITMLADGVATGMVIDKVQSALTPGSIWIDMSSIKPQEARAQSTILLDKGLGYLDAPVSGGTKGAQAATLAIMAVGISQTFPAAHDVLASMGRPTHVGPVGTGQLSKLANQAIVGITIGAVAEAMLLVQKGGADPAAVRAALSGGFADSTILQQHGERMTTGNFEPGGPSRFQLKDLDNVINEAVHLGLTLPLAGDIRDRFAHLVDEMDGAELDHSGLFLELLKRNETQG